MNPLGISTVAFVFLGILWIGLIYTLIAIGGRITTVGNILVSILKEIKKSNLYLQEVDEIQPFIKQIEQNTRKSSGGSKP
jgi:hypothetical protein